MSRTHTLHRHATLARSYRERHVLRHLSMVRYARKLVRQRRDQGA